MFKISAIVVLEYKYRKIASCKISVFGKMQEGYLPLLFELFQLDMDVDILLKICTTHSILNYSLYF